MGWPFGPLLQLLLVTDQREDEVAAMKWSDVDLARGIWMLPREVAHQDEPRFREP